MSQSGTRTAPVDPHIRELEETFVSCLGWGLTKCVDNYDRWITPVSAGLGLDPACIVNVDLRDIYEAIRTHYLDTEAFSWQAVRSTLIAQGWFGTWGTSYATRRHTAYVDVVCNQFTTVGAIPSLRKMIEAEAEKRSGPRAPRGGYE